MFNKNGRFTKTRKFSQKPILKPETLSVHPTERGNTVKEDKSKSRDVYKLKRTKKTETWTGSNK